MRKFTLLLLLLAGLIAAVTTAPVPAPNPHHGGPHASDVEEEDGLKWVSEARMRKKPMNPKSMAAKGNMSRKKANMRKQEGMMKKSNMNDKPKMKSNAKRRKNSNKNANKRRQPTSKAPSGQKQGYASFAERLQALRAQQRKEADDQRKRERDEYLSILKETGEISAEEDTIKYEQQEEFNPFKQEQKEQQKLLKQQAVPLVPETAGLGLPVEDDDDDYNPFDVEEDLEYEKYTREQVEKEQKRIEAERAESIRERMRDREALKWNNRRGQNRAQERMDTGEEPDAYPARFRFIKDLNLSARHRQRMEKEKEAQKMNPLNPLFKARQKSYVNAWRSKMRI